MLVKPMLIVLGIMLMAASASAQGISFIQGNDGTSGTVMDLGNGVHSYSDSHGTMGTIMDLGGGLQTYQFISPKGPVSGTILTIPSPNTPSSMAPGVPPAGMTPAPVLPFTPQGPLMPQQTAPFSSNYGVGTVGSGGGRFGR